MGAVFIKRPHKGKNIMEERKINWTLCLLMSIFFGELGVDRFK